MSLRNLDDVRQLFVSLDGTLVGIGMTAFSRITPSFFLRPYHLVSLRKTQDLESLRRTSRIFCLEEKTGGHLFEKKYDSAKLLSHPLVRNFLNSLPNPKSLFLYQNYPELKVLSQKEGWTLLANPAGLRLRINKRRFFIQMVNDLGLPGLSGDIFPIGEIQRRGYDTWVAEMGPRFVIQLPDLVQGGGRGTFFVNFSAEYQRIQEYLGHQNWRSIPLKTVFVRRLVDGISASIVLCMTKHGILHSRLQRQLIDLPHCEGIPEDGIFCGHAWSLSSWPSFVEQDALNQASRIGSHLARLGYKGILGIDFLIENRTRKVYPIEINPRITGTFPMLSLLHMTNRVIPLEIFHLLEFLNVPYQIEVDGLNEEYARPIQGSHVLVFLASEGQPIKIKALRAGLYEWDQERQRASFIKPTVDTQQIRNERQFIVVDAPPDAFEEAVTCSDPLLRLCRILFSYPVVDDNGTHSGLALQTVDWVRRQIVGNP